MKIEIVDADIMSPADFAAFVDLEKQFAKHYEKLGVGKQYGRLPFDRLTETAHELEFDHYFGGGDSLFVFAKQGDQYIGYLAGYVKDLPPDYQVRQVGFLDSVIVAEDCRGSGVGRLLCDYFYNWLRSKGIYFCQLAVKIENQEAVALYKKWGFTVEGLRMWKEI